MQLILAIDSDPRRSEQLASLVRARLTVEFVQATSAGEGLQTLKDRIPDLILTSPLLSPFDDGVLDEYLRDLGAAGAHVQTVRIPVLSATPKKKALASKLLKLGRTKPTSAATPDGCDPKIFADEIAVYLSRAASARQSVAHLAHASSPRQDEAPPSAVAANSVVVDPAEFSQELIEEFADASELAEAEIAEPLYVEAEPRYEAAEPLPDVVDEPTPIESYESSPSNEARETAPRFLDRLRDAEQTTRPEPTEEAPRNSATFEAALAAIRAAWVKPGETVTAQSSSATAPAPRSTAHSEVDLTKTIDALPDSRPTSPAQREVDKPKTRPKNGRGRETDASDRRPVQNEWGIFDPDQCGLSVLVDKLDEVAESKDAPKSPRRDEKGDFNRVPIYGRLIT